MLRSLPLDRLASVRTGVTLRTPRERMPPGDTLVVQMRDVRDGALDPAAPRVAFDAADLDRHRLWPGDVLVAARAPYAATLLDDPPERAVATSHFYVVRTTDARVRPDYLATVLASPAARAFFGRHEQGTTLRLISKKTLDQLRVPLLPLDRQADVAAADRALRREAALLRRRADLAERRADALLARVLGP